MYPTFSCNNYIIYSKTRERLPGTIHLHATRKNTTTIIGTRQCAFGLCPLLCRHICHSACASEQSITKAVFLVSSLHRKAYTSLGEPLMTGTTSVAPRSDCLVSRRISQSVAGHDGDGETCIGDKSCSQLLTNASPGVRLGPPTPLYFLYSPVS